MIGAIRAPMRPPWTAARIALLTAHAIPALRHLRMDAWDYDEGATLQAAALALRGARLYRDVPLNKPPLLATLLHGAFALAGPGVAAGRLVALALGIATLAALSSLATAWWGAGAGVALLGLALLVREVPVRLAVVMSDLPALGAAAFALSLAWRARTSARGATWAASGLLLAASAAFHPLLAGALVPWAMTAFDLSAPQRRRACAALLAGGVALAALLACFDAPGMLRWVVRYNHAHLGDLDHETSGHMIRRWLRESAVWTAAALAAWAWLIARPDTRRAGVLSAAWWLATLATLRVWRPLWENYRVWVELTMALPVAGALATVRGRWRLAWAVAPLLALAAQRPSWPRWDASREAARAFLARQPADAAVLSDDPFLALAAGRLVPPSLADTSFKRIATGYLRLDDVRAAAGGGPAVVVFASGRFDRLFGLRAWASSRASETFRAGAVTVYALPVTRSARRSSR